MTDLGLKDEALARDGEIVSKLESQLRSMKNTVQETSFKIKLYQARGHIDIKRLRGSAEKLKVCRILQVKLGKKNLSPGSRGCSPDPGREAGRA